MSFENCLQFISEEDGCVYVYDPEKEEWEKICKVETLPPSVMRKIREAQNKAKQVLNIKLI
jgi:hypothetical protein